MAGPATEPSERPAPDVDTLLNRANLALARSRRVVASWLPPKTSGDQGATGTGEAADDDEEDEEMFKPVPEL